MNAKQEAFAREYCLDHNGTQAAIRAGYARSSAGAQAHKLLKKAEIKAYVRTQTETRAMTVDEALRQVAIIAQTARVPGDRLRALDMLLKAGGAYIEQRQITGSITLADKTPGPKKRRIK